MSRLLTESEVTSFEKILADYEPNNVVLEQFRNSNFVVIAGPAGAGKDTLRDGLIEKYPDKYLPILSTTTRPARQGETDGLTYHFREIQEVEDGFERREFFQAALVHNQQVSCLHVDEVRKLKPGQYGLSILIPSTEKELRVIKPDIKTVFLIPPSLDKLKSRMQAERTLGVDEVSRRLQAASKEMQAALDEPGYYCIVSDEISKMTAKAHKFLQTGRRDLAEDSRARDIIRRILDSYDL